MGHNGVFHVSPIDHARDATVSFLIMNSGERMSCSDSETLVTRRKLLTY